MANWIRRALAKIGADATISRDADSSALEERAEELGSIAPHLPQDPVPSSEHHSAFPSANGPNWTVGEVALGLYEVKDTIPGGMGLIHRVRHLGWDMDLAVKVPRPEFFRTQNQKALFVAECERWIDLGLHTNLVSCYYVRVLDGVPTVFAEWVDGGSLAEWIHSRRLYRGDAREGLLRILDIAIQFAWGLNYSHAKKVVHQDVKPSNVMVRLDGVTKVTDFGIARAAALDGPMESSRGGSALFVESGGSTRPYRSPEQAAKRNTSASKSPLLSHKTDIWSWAVSVLEMFCGGLLWEDGQIAAEVLREIGARGRQVNLALSIPPAVYRLLEHCLHIDPGSRPANMLDVVNALVPLYEESARHAYPRSLIKRASGGGPCADVPLSAGGDVSNRALSLVDLGKSEDAARLLRLWLKEHPTDPVAWCNEALIRVGTKDTLVSEAVSQYVECVHPSQPRWHDLGVEPRRYLSFVARHYNARHASPMVGLHWLSAHRTALTISQDGLLMRWEVEEKGWTLQYETRACGGEVTGSWLIKDRYLVVGHADGRLELRALEGGDLLKGVRLEPTYKAPHSVLSGTSLPISNAVRGVVHDVANDTLRVYLQNADAMELSIPALEILSDRHEQRDFTFCVAAPGDCAFVVVGELQGVLRFYVAGENGPYRVIDNKHQVPTHDLRTGEKGTVVGLVDLRCLACSPDGDWVASGSREGGVLLWRTQDILSAPFNPDLSSFKDWIFPGPIEALAFSPDSQRLFFSDSSHIVRSVNLPAVGEPTVVAKLGSEARVLAPSPNSNSLAMGCSDGTVLLEPIGGLQLVDLPFLITRPTSPEEHLRKHEQLRSIALGARAAFSESRYVECHELLDQGLGLGPEDEELRRSFRDLMLRLPARRTDIRSIMGKWSFSGFTRALQSAVGHRPYVNALSVGSRRGFVVVATDEGVHRLRLADGTTIDRRDIRQVRAIDYDENEDSCAVCTVLGAVGIVRFSETSGLSLEPAGGTLTSIARIARLGGVEPQTCVCASADGRLVFWRGADAFSRLHVMRHSIETIAVAQDSSWLAVAGADEFIGCVDIVSGRGLARLEGHTDPIRCLRFHPEGNLLASGGDDTTVRLWNVTDKSEYRLLKGHVGRVQSLAFSPDGDWLASGDSGGGIHLWDVFGEHHTVLESPHGEISDLAFDQQGGTLISGHRQGTVCAWEVTWQIDLAQVNQSRHQDQAGRREAARSQSPRPG